MIDGGLFRAEGQTLLGKPPPILVIGRGLPNRPIIYKLHLLDIYIDNENLLLWVESVFIFCLLSV